MHLPSVLITSGIFSLMPKPRAKLNKSKFFGSKCHMRRVKECGVRLDTIGGRCNAVTRVERVENGVTVEYTQQEDIERVVREETQSRFSAAESSPFCQGLLGEELGYVSDTSTALPF
jgi:hypothetical protein